MIIFFKILFKLKSKIQKGIYKKFSLAAIYMYLQFTIFSKKMRRKGTKFICRGSIKLPAPTS